MKQIRLPGILFLFLLISGIAAGWGTKAEAATTQVRIEVTYEQNSARNMLDSINSFRKSDDAWAWNESNTEKVSYSGLQDLTYDVELEKVAMKRAAEIALLFSHTRPNGLKSNTAGGWGTSDNVYGFACGENIAAGQGTKGTAEATFTSWREDDEDYSGQGHRRNMLSENFKAIGIGHVIFNGTHYWVQAFGDEIHSSTAEAKNEAVTESIEVEEDLISDSTITFTPAVQSLTIPWLSEDTSIPDTQAAIYLKVDEHNYTWPKKAPVLADLDWTSGDTSTVEIKSSKLIGKKTGTTNISTSFLGTELTLPVTVEPLSIDHLPVAVEDTVYNGSPQTPAVIVGDVDSPLIQGTDYEVSCSNNINAGTANISVTGKGNYKGTVEKTFTISKRSILDAVISDMQDLVYNGSPQKQNLSLSISDRTLTEQDDYTAVYKNNINAGTATVTITGQGNYEGTLEKSYTIKPVALTDYTAEDIPDTVYSGAPCKPKVAISGLPNGAEYTIEYNNNINAGTASAIITGNKNCTGTLTVSFIIDQADIGSASVKAADQVYTGEKLTPPVTVTINDTALEEGKDFEIPENGFNNNTEKGTATVMIRGINNYRGNASGSFTIHGFSLREMYESNILTITDVADQTYSGESFLPDLDIIANGTKLIEGEDYIRTDLNNKNAGTATILLTGQKLYEGTITISYQIKKASITDAVITGIKNKTYTGKSQNQNLTVTYGTLALKPGVDFKVTYKNNVNAGKSIVLISGIGNYTGTQSKQFSINKAAQKVTAGNKTINIKAKALKKKARIIRPAIITKGSKAKTRITYKILKVNKNKKAFKLTSSGKLTVKKGTKKGKYKITVRATAASSGNYNAARKDFIITINVK